MMDGRISVITAHEINRMDTIDAKGIVAASKLPSHESAVATD